MDTTLQVSVIFCKWRKCMYVESSISWLNFYSLFNINYIWIHVSASIGKLVCGQRTLTSPLHRWHALQQFLFASEDLQIFVGNSKRLTNTMYLFTQCALFFKVTNRVLREKWPLSPASAHSVTYTFLRIY